MNRTDYEANPAVNFSTLSKILRSPAHYKAALAVKREPTPAMILGTLAHSMILEGIALANLATVKPEGIDYRTKAGKEWRDSQTLPVITSEDEANLKGMELAVVSHPEASKILTECPSRETFLESEVYDVPIKGLIDAHGTVILADLKTTQDASEQAFVRKCQDLHYDFQMAFYQRLLGPEYWCSWIVVESEAPYACNVFTPSAALLESGREKMRRAIALYKQCAAADAWPAFTGITTLHVPKWREIELQNTEQ